MRGTTNIKILESCTSRYVAHRQIGETRQYHSVRFISLNKIIFAIKSGVIVVSNPQKRRFSNSMVLSL